MHRKLMRYTQKEAAARLQIQVNQLSKWENGTQMPNGINIFKLGILYRTIPTELYPELIEELKHQLRAQALVQD